MKFNPSILIVETDAQSRASLRAILEDLGYTPVYTATAAEARAKLRERSFDLVISGMALNAGSTGLEIARAVTWRWPGTAVILVTGDRTFDAVKAAIDVGADGYVLKPIKRTELCKAVEQALRRWEAASSSERPLSIQDGSGLTLDEEKAEVRMDENRIDLTSTEYKLLAYLMHDAHRVVSPVELVEAMQGHSPKDEEQAATTVRWHIHNLRQKIEPHPHTPIYILSVYGRGYTFGGPGADSR